MEAMSVHWPDKTDDLLVPDQALTSESTNDRVSLAG